MDAMLSFLELRKYGQPLRSKGVLTKGLDVMMASLTCQGFPNFQKQQHCKYDGATLRMQCSYFNYV